jgi:hypothetical protein
MSKIPQSTPIDNPAAYAWKHQQAADDTLQSLQLEHRMGRSLNDFFNSRSYFLVGGGNLQANLDLFWTGTGLTSPLGGGIAAYSRRTFKYPLLVMRTILPILDVNNRIWIGFEDGDSTPGQNIIAFYMDNNFRMIGSGNSRAANAALPATYDTAVNTYKLKINKNNAEFFVNDVLVQVSIFDLAPAPLVIADYPPYIVLNTPRWNGLEEITALAEIYNVTGAQRTIGCDITGNNFTIGDGVPIPGRVYPLYTTATLDLWTGLAIGAAVTSHPIPVWGYSNRTLYFETGAAGGTIVIQSYRSVGGWFNYETKVLAANTPWVYALTNEMIAARCVYTPNGAETIGNAEMYLS